MLRTSLFFLFVVSLGVLCSDAKKISGTRDSCKPFGKGRGNTTREVCIRQHGKSGKFSISLGRNKGEDDLKTVTIMFDAIRELDKNGNIIGKAGARAGKHSYENFAQLEFDYSDLVNTSYKGIQAYGFNFSALIPGPNATLNIPIYIFKKNGTIDLCDNEQIEIKRGMVKFNIELSNWNFCKAGSGCRQRSRNEEEIGDFVDFVIEIKNKGKAVKGRKMKKQKGMKRKAMKFYFGKNPISFPSAVVSDGNCKEMAEEYPKLDVKGGKHSVSFRFPKFNDRVIFDPAVNVIEDEDPPPPESGSGAKLLFPSLGVIILGVLARLFF